MHLHAGNEEEQIEGHGNLPETAEKETVMEKEKEGETEKIEGDENNKEYKVTTEGETGEKEKESKVEKKKKDEKENTEGDGNDNVKKKNSEEETDKKTFLGISVENSLSLSSSESDPAEKKVSMSEDDVAVGIPVPHPTRSRTTSLARRKGIQSALVSDSEGFSTPEKSIPKGKKTSNFV